MEEFHKWVKMWDTLNPKNVTANSKEYFRKEISDMVVHELYKQNIKPSSQPDKYAPTFRCKIPVSSDEPTADFYAVDSQGTSPTDMNRIKNGSRVIALLKTTGLWFAGKSFGMNFHVVQMVQLASDKFEGCAIAVPSHLLPAPAAPAPLIANFDPGTPPNTSPDRPEKRQRTALVV